MRDLPPEAKELLARVRAEQPRSTAATRARVRAAVADAIAGARPPALDQLDEATPFGGAKTTKQAPVLKLAVLAVAVGMTGALVFLAARPAAPVPPQVPAHEAAQHTDERAPMQTSAEPAPAKAADSVRRPSAARSANATTASTGQGALGAELRLVRQADQALRAGDAPAALKALATHRARFGNGQLAHERDGLAVLAECTLGTAGAPERAAIYLRQHPASLVEQRLVNACALRPPP